MGAVYIRREAEAKTTECPWRFGMGNPNCLGKNCAAWQIHSAKKTVIHGRPAPEAQNGEEWIKVGETGQGGLVTHEDHYRSDHLGSCARLAT